VAAPSAQAQPVVIGVGVGVGGPVYVGRPPVCPYGYYGYYPYACAPYGYYGPQWFFGGVFIGAGPWFHRFYGRPGYFGRSGFYGRPGFMGGSVARGPAHYAYGPVGGGYRGSYARGGFARGGFHGGGHR